MKPEYGNYFWSQPKTSTDTGSDEEENSDAADNEQIDNFTELMSSSTRKVHKLTDHLVNAKLGIAISDSRIWAEGILIFYEIFRYLESALTRLKGRVEVFERMSKVLDGIERTEAFESDISYYYGNGFLKSSAYAIRPSVAKYVHHLQRLEDTEPLRLMAYIYHMYLGLLSGGQILKRKRDFHEKLATLGGVIGNTTSANLDAKDKVVVFGIDGRSIKDIKRDIKFTMNDIANDLSCDERQSLLDEGILVFRYNLEILRTIKGTGKAATLAILLHPLFIFIISVLAIFLWYHFSGTLN